jgi:hypothetical protein
LDSGRPPPIIHPVRPAPLFVRLPAGLDLSIAMRGHMRAHILSPPFDATLLGLDSFEEIFAAVTSKMIGDPA